MGTILGSSCSKSVWPMTSVRSRTWSVGWKVTGDGEWIADGLSVQEMAGSCRGDRRR